MAFGRGSDRLEAPAVPQDDNGRPGQLFPYELVSEIDAMQYGFPLGRFNLELKLRNREQPNNFRYDCALQTEQLR
jgi:hypothetical protein